MFTLVVTTILFASTEMQSIEAMETASVPGFATIEACEAAAQQIGGRSLNVERQTLCVALDN